MPVVIGSSVGGLLLLVVIIALLVKVSSSPPVCKKEKALVLVSVHLRTAKLRPSAPTLTLWALFFVVEAMCPV